MKKLAILTFLLAISTALFSQQFTISYLQWSNPTSFQLSPSPNIKGYGFYSDSLSNIYKGATFYEYNGEYYRINSWADYYYWFVKKYWFLFVDGAHYEFYYLTNNDLGMASYISSYKYSGKYYPSSILIDFEDEIVSENRLASNVYFINNNKELSLFEKELDYSSIDGVKSPALDREMKPQLSPVLFDKDKYRKQNIDKLQKPNQTEASRKNDANVNKNIKSK